MSWLDDGVFSVGLRAGGGEAAVAGALGRLIARLVEQPMEHAVILETCATPLDDVYAQVLVADGGGAYFEVMSDAFRRPERPLTPAQRDTLRRLGYRPPDRSPNHSMLWRAPVDWGQVAAHLLRTLVLVEGLADDASIKVLTFPTRDFDDPDDWDDDGD